MGTTIGNNFETTMKRLYTMNYEKTMGHLGEKYGKTMKKL